MLGNYLAGKDDYEMMVDVTNTETPVKEIDHASVDNKMTPFFVEGVSKSVY